MAAAPGNREEAKSWTVDTNWTIAGGSITDTVSLESSFSPIDDADNSEAKPPLILCPNSSESFAPEITVKFSQKHEIRQVYLRSTARVYEVYYTEEHGSCAEYLSTIRCGPATRDGSVLQAFNFEETSFPNRCNPRKQPNEDDHGKNSQNEESWVEVIVTENSLSSKSSSLSLDDCDETISKTPQDFHEAAAEINDMNPCTSVTFKLLSLGNKSCLCVDELYIYADPVCEQSSENPDENHTKSSLMTMILPAIMQFSSSRKEAPITEERKTIKSIDEASPKECHSSPSSSVKDTKSNESEALLNQIITRISRVEEHLLRFEKNVLIPIKSIDERLGRVENQLESLSKKPPATIHTPEFQRNESDDKTSHNCEETEVKSEEPDYTDEIGEESVKEFAEQKRHVSIDEALASALAGFMMSPNAVPVISGEEESESADDDKEEDEGLRSEELLIHEKKWKDSVEDSVGNVASMPTNKVSIKPSIDEVMTGSSDAGKGEERIETCFGELSESIYSEEWEFQSACEMREGATENINWIIQESLI